MTNEIIAVNYDENNDRPTVMGRDLHEALEIETPYHKWFPRMCEYGFSENEDFWTILSESTGGRPSTDHQLTIDMAKELCMIQRSDKGKMFRQYFIEVEKQWNTPEAVMARALKIASNKIGMLEAKIEADKPLVEFAEHIQQSEDCIDMKAMAKIATKKGIKIGRNKLFEFLRLKDVLMTNNEPYQSYMERGWFEVIEKTYTPAFGEIRITKTTLVKPKGQVGIIKMLKKYFE